MERPFNPKNELHIEGGLINVLPKGFPFSRTGGAAKAKDLYVFNGPHSVEWENAKPQIQVFFPRRP